VQTSLCLPGDLDDVGGLSLLSAAERLALGGRAAVVPGCLDEQPAGVPGVERCLISGRERVLALFIAGIVPAGLAGFGRS
jgi:hypothetical protein